MERHVRTGAGIVAFHPDLVALERLIAVLSRQVDCIVLVNNGGAEVAFPGVARLDAGGNLGVATGHNRAVERLRAEGCSHVLLMDQDSLPAPDMVARLHQALAALPDAACVGPRFRDPRQAQLKPFCRVEGLLLRRCGSEEGDGIVAVDHVVSSGCLIPLSVIDTVGGMRDELFIDYVDIEWGLRAKRHGLQSYGVCGATMTHTLGEAPVEIFGRRIPLHSALRHYYQFRNGVWLFLQAWPPLNWKLVHASRLLVRFAFNAWFGRPRLEHFRMMVLGIWHGLRGRLGELQRQNA